MKFNETQLAEIARVQEERSTTRSAAIKFCQRRWKAGTTGHLLALAAAAPALAKVEDDLSKPFDSTAEQGGYAKGNRTRVANKAKKAKATVVAKAAPVKQYALRADVDTKKFTRGFLAEFLAFAGKKDAVTVASLVAEFGGRQIDGHKVNELRIRRYVSYCLSNDLFKAVK